MRLIDADELLGNIFFVEDEEGFMTAVVAKADIEREATIDASPVVHAEIENIRPLHIRDRFGCCSLCGKTVYYKSKYCPSCGAKMDKEASNGLADS